MALLVRLISVMCLKYLHIGGLIAMGFDPSGRYLITLSHSGRGVFDLRTWERVARDTESAYPEHGFVEGIGPLNGQRLPVKELNYDTETLEVTTPDEAFRLRYSEGAVEIVPAGT